MLLKIFFIYLNIFAVKLVLSQTIYNASPYPSASVSPLSGYPVASGTAPITVPATPYPASSSPMAVAASPIPVAASPVPVAASPITVSPIATGSTATTEPKAYFVPAGPIPDPIVTVLGDIPAVVEVKPKIYPDVPSAYPDPGYIEVKATLCKDGIPNSNAPAGKPVLPGKNGPLAPVKRLTMACANDDPLLAAHKSSLLPTKSECASISKMDLLPPVTACQNNPIDFDGLLDGFMTCL